jgi:hypothetical protein
VASSSSGLTPTDETVLLYAVPHAARGQGVKRSGDSQAAGAPFQVKGKREVKELGLSSSLLLLQFYF